MDFSGMTKRGSGSIKTAACGGRRFVWCYVQRLLIEFIDSRWFADVNV